MSDPATDHWASWYFALACLRAQHEAGRRLSPREMAEAVERRQRAPAPDEGSLT